MRPGRRRRALSNFRTGAGLNVFENEPHVPEALLKMDQIVLAPHVGSATNECRMEMGMTALANLISFLTTGAAINVAKG